jgi:hypothetical protein
MGRRRLSADTVRDPTHIWQDCGHLWTEKNQCHRHGRFYNYFTVKVPIGIVITILAIYSIPKDIPASGEKFDPAGSVLIIFSLALILLPIAAMSKATVNAALVIGSLAAGLILLAVFLIHEYRCNHPILNLNLFRNRVFSASNFAATFFFMTEYMLLFLWPYYLQN